MSIYEIETADGSIYEIETADSTPEAKPLKAGETLAGGFTNLLQGLTFGAGDEIVAAGNAALDAVFGGSGYSERLKQARDLSSRYAAENPVSGALNSLSGLLAPTPNIMSKAKGAKAALGNIAKGTGLGAAYGAVSGFLGGEGSASDRAAQAAEGAKVGAAIGAPLAAAGEAVQGIAGKMARAVPALERKSIGARQSDYAKTAKDIGIIDIGDGLETTTKAAVDDLLLSGKLGQSRDPQTILAKANANEKELSASVGALVGAADKAQARPIVPTWDRTMVMLESGQVPGDRIDDYVRRLEEIDAAIQGKGKGRLSFIQQQKVALGKEWDPNDGTKNEFTRALYSDLQRAVEGVVPEVAPLNRELSKYKMVKPILQRLLAAGETANPIDSIIGAIKTTGGFGVPILAGAYMGDDKGAIGGAALAAAMFGARTPKGQKVLADLFSKAAPKLNTAGNVASRLIPGTVSARTSAKQNKATEETKGSPKGSTYLNSALFGSATPAKNTASLFAPTSASLSSLFGGARNDTPALLAAALESKKNGDAVKYADLVDQLVPAVVHAESRGRAEAVSPKGARGVMQIMPATWREWAPKVGVALNAIHDPEANEKVGRAYLNWLLEQTGGDPALALAAYNHGIGNVQKLQADPKLGKDFASIFPQLPLETQQYVLNILGKGALA